MFRYVIAGEENKAMAVKSSLNLDEFEQLIRSQSRKLHPKGHDTVWTWGVTEYINPRVYIGSDWLDHLPALIAVD